MICAKTESLVFPGQIWYFSSGSNGPAIKLIIVFELTIFTDFAIFKEKTQVLTKEPNLKLVTIINSWLHCTAPVEEILTIGIDTFVRVICSTCCPLSHHTGCVGWITERFASCLIVITNSFCRCHASIFCSCTGFFTSIYRCRIVMGVAAARALCIFSVGSYRGHNGAWKTFTSTDTSCESSIRISRTICLTSCFSGGAAYFSIIVTCGVGFCAASEILVRCIIFALCLSIWTNYFSGWCTCARICWNFCSRWPPAIIVRCLAVVLDVLARIPLLVAGVGVCCVVFQLVPGLVLVGIQEAGIDQVFMLVH